MMSVRVAVFCLVMGTAAGMHLPSPRPPPVCTCVMLTANRGGCLRAGCGSDADCAAVGPNVDADCSFSSGAGVCVTVTCVDGQFLDDSMTPATCVACTAMTGVDPANVVCTDATDSKDDMSCDMSSAAETCLETVADCATGYTAGLVGTPSTTCPTGCTQVDAAAATTETCADTVDTQVVANCTAGYTAGTAATPSTTCPATVCAQVNAVAEVTASAETCPPTVAEVVTDCV